MPAITPAFATAGAYRWRILALLLFATTINYLDRSILGVLGPTLQYQVFHWSDQDYALVNIAFKAAYAVGLVTMGALTDRVGTKSGYSLAICIWSVFGMLHAAVRPAFGLVGFCAARFGFGLGQAGNFPAAIKALAEWFPRQERALAMGIMLIGSNLGPILAPILVPLVVWSDGTHWEWAFLITGAFSALWLLLWWRLYRRPEAHPHLAAAELAHIRGEARPESAARLPWRRVLPLRETWAFAALKITDAVWWFYLFWGGKFLFDRFGLSLKELALPLVVIYVIATAGSVAGGGLSSALLRRGWTVNRARKTTLLVFALCLMPVMFVTQLGTRFNLDERFFARLQTATYLDELITTRAGDATRERLRRPVPPEAQEALLALAGRSYGSAREFMAAVKQILPPTQAAQLEQALCRSARSDNLYWIAVLLMGLAAGSHQGWSCNVLTVVSDVFPKKATASVAGLGGMVGALAGIAADRILGDLLARSGPAGYFFAFLAAGTCYLLVLGLAHLLMPRMTPLDENLQPTA